MAASTDMTDDLNAIGDMDVKRDISGESAKRKLPIISVALSLLVVGGLTAVFGFNAFNIRDQHIWPFLREIPFVGGLISDEVTQGLYVDGQPMEIPVDASVIALMAELEIAQTALIQAQALNEQYAETVGVLREYRDIITEYRENRQRFDQMVALGEQLAFTAFFESMDPENAANLYSQIQTAQQADREFRRYAATYREMSPENAAEVFAILLNTNPELLLEILHTFNNAQRAAVFSAMEASEVAVITILMAPDVNPVDILPSVPLIDGNVTPVPVVTVADMPSEEEGNENEETVELEEEA